MVAVWSGGGVVPVGVGRVALVVVRLFAPFPPFALPVEPLVLLLLLGADTQNRRDCRTGNHNQRNGVNHDFVFGKHAFLLFEGHLWMYLNEYACEGGEVSFCLTFLWCCDA